MKQLLVLISFVYFLVSCDPPGGGLVYDPDQFEKKEYEGIDPGKESSGCYPAFDDDELNIATWNIEFFSKSNTGTFH